MKKLLFLSMLLIVPVIIFAQDLNIPDNVYDKADDYTKSKKAFKKNIAAEINAGKPKSQAAAIAYSVQRKAQGRGK